MHLLIFDALILSSISKVNTTKTTLATTSKISYIHEYWILQLLKMITSNFGGIILGRKMRLLNAHYRFL